jgi:putative peptide zinc metalloprotease protein
VKRVDESIKAACPVAAGRMGAWQMFPGIHLIGNRSLDRYIAVPAAKLEVVKEIVAGFDGRRSVSSIANQFASRGQRVDVGGLVSRLGNAGLLRGSDQNTEMSRAAVPLGEINIAGPFAYSRHLIRSLFAPILWMTALILAAGLYALFTTSPTPLRQQQSSALSNIFFPAALILSILIHELAHAVTATRFGALPVRLRLVSYLLVIPAALMTIRGLYAVPAWKRILVWSAGIWASATLAAAALAAGRLFPIEPTYQALLERVAIANALIAGWNLMPFLPTDGYFIFSTLLKRPNIRAKAWRQLWIFGHKRGRTDGWLLLYALASLAITGFVVYQNAVVLGAMAAESIRGFFVAGLIVAALATFAILRRRSAARSRQRSSLKA